MTLNHGDVRRERGVLVEPAHERAAMEEGVQVDRRSTGGRLVVARVDEVRPDLESLHRVKPSAKRPEEVGGERGLAGTALSGGDGCIAHG